MRAFITGIDGFVGAHLADHLRRQGYDVVGMSMEKSDPPQVFLCNLLDENRLAEVLNIVRPDVLFHLAGFTSVKASWENPELAMRVNRNGTKNLYEALRAQEFQGRILISGTAEVYGIPKTTPVTEKSPTDPQSPYAESKKAQEDVAGTFPDIATVITRSFPHTGPGQLPPFALADFARQIVCIERGMQDELRVGNLAAQRDYTDVRDVVVAYRMLGERGHPGEIYNVCSGTAQSMEAFLQLLIGHAKAPIRIAVDRERLRPVDIPMLVGDRAKLTAATGWQPSIPLAVTMRDVLDFWRSRPDTQLEPRNP